jgi:hypothetical protein
MFPFALECLKEESLLARHPYTISAFGTGRYGISGPLESQSATGAGRCWVTCIMKEDLIDKLLCTATRRRWLEPDRLQIEGGRPAKLCMSCRSQVLRPNDPISSEGLTCWSQRKSRTEVGP